MNDTIPLPTPIQETNTNRTFRGIHLKNFLSFGPNGMSLELLPLNVFIGPNGAGKSNLLEAIGFLSSATKGLSLPVRMGGGVLDWIHQNSADKTALIQVKMLNTPFNTKRFRCDLEYSLGFASIHNRFEVVEESLTTATPLTPDKNDNFIYYSHDGKKTLINALTDDNPQKGKADGGRKTRRLERKDIATNASILSQRKDPTVYPELTFVNDVFSKIRIYREWRFGIGNPLRQPQPSDSETDYLEEDFTNAAMFINRLKDDREANNKFVGIVSELYAGIEDVDARIESGRAILRVTENNFGKAISANRLSDGTLRFVCLAALLLSPTLPPVICLDEPELGMHPDMIHALALLLKDASQRTQLLVTTHSVQLLDALSDTPEAVIVCERENGQTTMRRLTRDDLAVWLDKYGLGRLWRDGVFGGNRW